MAVKDIEASMKFYEKFGFKPFGGNPAQKWVILKNGYSIIGLFQGMFEKNILPGRSARLTSRMSLA